jgi:hypothetical protein
MNHGVVPDQAATAECGPGGDVLAAVGAFSPEGAKGAVALSTDGERDGFFKVGFPGLVGFSLKGRKE